MGAQDCRPPRRAAGILAARDNNASGKCVQDLLPGFTSRRSVGPETLKSVAERLLIPPPSDIDAWFDGLMQNCDESYRSLLGRGLIEDPASMVVIAMVVVGMIPVSFTRQTEAGEQVLLRINSLFYEYERSVEGPKVITKARFRVMQLVRAFFAAARSGFTQSWEQVEKEIEQEKKAHRS